MGLRGPQPKPTRIRLIEGNPSGRPINKNEPQPRQITELHPPDDMSEDGKRVWRALSQELITIGLLTAVDINAFARYIDYLLEYRMAVNALKDGKYIIALKNPDGSLKYMQQHPMLSIKHKASAELARLENVFGMNPSARVRMMAVANGAGAPPDDPYEP